MGLTDVGAVRDNNEDYHFIDNEIGLYIVCDGVGGSKGGEVASKMATEVCVNFIQQNKHIIEEYYCLGNNDSLVRQLMQAAMLESCKSVYHAGLNDLNLNGMSTTMTAMLTLNNKVVLGHVGDSRLYLIRNNQVHLVTEDHTIGNEMRQNHFFTAPGVPTSQYDSVLSRSIGHQESVEVDIMMFDLIPTDKLLLCSDGFYNYLSRPIEIIPMVDEDNRKALRTMINYAIHRGGTDNITCILIDVSLEESSYENLKFDKSELLNDLSILENYLFRNLSFIRLNQILNRCETYEIDPCEIICEEGQSPDGLFIIFGGSIAVYRQGAIHTTLKKGQIFGQYSLMFEMKEKFSYHAGEACRVLYMSSSSYRSLCRKYPKFGIQLLENFIQGCEAMVTTSSSSE
jgi:serine/threonine protein phosphatase PrpC